MCKAMSLESQVTSESQVSQVTRRLVLPLRLTETRHPSVVLLLAPLLKYIRKWYPRCRTSCRFLREDFGFPTIHWSHWSHSATVPRNVSSDPIFMRSIVSSDVGTWNLGLGTSQLELGQLETSFYFSFPNLSEEILEVSVIHIWILLHLFSSSLSMSFSSLALLSQVTRQPALPRRQTETCHPCVILVLTPLSTSRTNPIGSIRSQVSAHLSNTTIQQWRQIPFDTTSSPLPALATHVSLPLRLHNKFHLKNAFLEPRATS